MLAPFCPLHVSAHCTFRLLTVRWAYHFYSVSEVTTSQIGLAKHELSEAFGSHGVSWHQSLLFPGIALKAVANAVMHAIALGKV